MNIAELVKALEGLGDDPSPEDVTKAFRSTARPAYQAAFDEGHGSATGDSKSKVEAAEAAAEAAGKKAAAADKKVKKLEESTPDTAAIRKEYDAEITRINTEHEEALGAERDKGRGIMRTSSRKDLLRALTIEHGVDADYAEVLIEKQDVRDRIVVGDDGAIVVHQKGKQIPLAAADDRSPVELLGEELAQDVAPKWKNSKADRGSGVRDHQGGKGGPGDVYAKMREEQAEKEKARSAGSTSAKEKMGLVRTT